MFADDEVASAVTAIAALLARYRGLDYSLTVSVCCLLSTGMNFSTRSRRPVKDARPTLQCINPGTSAASSGQVLRYM